MINLLSNGIAESLNAEFGDSYKIYVEDVPQNFQEPCFAVTLVVGQDVPYLTGRRLRKYNFDIHYFPESVNRKNTELHSVESRLYSALEYINVLDILVRGTKMSSEIVDGVLHFFVSYDKFISENEPELPHMETLKLEDKNNGRRN